MGNIDDQALAGWALLALRGGILRFLASRMSGMSTPTTNAVVQNKKLILCSAKRLRYRGNRHATLRAELAILVSCPWRAARQSSCAQHQITVIIFFSVGIRVRVNIAGSAAIINFLVLAEVPVEERCVENKNTLAIFTMWCYFFGASAKGRVVWVSFAAG